MMGNILFVSPDLNLCASLLMYFYDKYSVTTTTDAGNVEKILGTGSYDLLVMDAEPDERINKLLADIRKTEGHPIAILTYVYQKKYGEAEESAKSNVDAVFYKPYDLEEVSKKIEALLAEAG